MSKVEDARDGLMDALNDYASAVEDGRYNVLQSRRQAVTAARETFEAEVRAEALEPYQELVEAARALHAACEPHAIFSRPMWDAANVLSEALEGIPSEPVEGT